MSNSNEQEQEQSEEQQVQEIVNLLVNIRSTLGLQTENIEQIFAPEMYIEIYIYLFPLMEKELTNLYNNQNLNPGQKFQNLINILADVVLNMDLTHINGIFRQEISQGNLKHLLNLIQLINEITLIIQNQEDGQDQQSLEQQQLQSQQQNMDMDNNQQNQQVEQNPEQEIPDVSDQFQQETNLQDNEQQEKFQSSQQQDSENQIQNNSNDQKVDDKVQTIEEKQLPEISQEVYLEYIQKGIEMLQLSEEDLEQLNEYVQSQLEENPEFQQNPEKFYFDIIQLALQEQGMQLEIDSQEFQRGSSEPQQLSIQEGNSNKQQPIDEKTALEQLKQQNIEARYQQKQEEDNQPEIIQDKQERQPSFTNINEKNQENEEQNQMDQQQYITGTFPNVQQSKEAQIQNIQQLHQSKAYQQQKLQSEIKKKAEQNIQGKKVIENQIENMIFPGQKNVKKILTANPNIQQEYEQFQQLQRQKQTLTQKSLEEASQKQQEIQENQENISNLQNLPEAEKAYSLSLQKQQTPSQLEPIPEGEQIQQQQEEDLNMYDNLMLGFNDTGGLFDILSENIQKIKGSLSQMKKINFPEDDKMTQQKILRQRNEYKKLLAEYLQYHRKSAIEEEQIKEGGLAQKNFIKKLKNLQARELEFQKQYDNEQKSQYFKMRDEKVNYLRKIHRLIFDQEKLKIIEDKKKQMENRSERNKDTQNVLDSIENVYKNKIQMLKEKLHSQKVERRNAEIAQKRVIVELEQQVRNQKLQQLEELQYIYQCERDKFELLIKDDKVLEEQIKHLYKKF